MAGSKIPLLALFVALLVGATIASVDVGGFLSDALFVDFLLGEKEPAETKNSNVFVCQLCGCSYCTPGLYPVGKPWAVIDLPEGSLDEEAQEVIDQLGGLTCGLIELVLGQVTEDECSDEFRLIPELRELCGCPPLPDQPCSTCFSNSWFGRFSCWFMCWFRKFIELWF